MEGCSSSEYWVRKGWDKAMLIYWYDARVCIYLTYISKCSLRYAGYVLSTVAEGSVS